jgi:hypothetical protein
MSQKTILLTYYGGTILFLLLDLVFHYSIRVTFLDFATEFRMLYYGFCMLCFLVMVWKPGLTVLLGAIESLLALSALILVMGMRVMVPTDQMLETGAGAVTLREIINFIIAGGIAYVAWGSSMQQLSRRQP